jgi:hypothetical protein
LAGAPNGTVVVMVVAKLVEVVVPTM